MPELQVLVVGLVKPPYQISLLFRLGQMSIQDAIPDIQYLSDQSILFLHKNLIIEFNSSR